MDELAFHEMAGAALVERGLMTQEAVAEDRMALEARLAGEDAPPAPSSDPLGLLSPPKGPTGSARLVGHGDQQAAPTQPEPVDPLTAEAFAPAKAPGEYAFGSVPDDKHDPAFDLEMRNLLHGAGVPTWLGSELGKRYNAACAGPLPTEAQIETSRQAAHVALNRRFGNDTPNIIKSACTAIDRLAEAKPEVRGILELTGLGNDPWLIESLAHLAQVRGWDR